MFLGNLAFGYVCEDVMAKGQYLHLVNEWQAPFHSNPRVAMGLWYIPEAGEGVIPQFGRLLDRSILFCW